MLQEIVALLQVGQTKEAFFLRISTIYPILDWRYKLIEKAYDDAEVAFKEKYRDSGELYFEHLRVVAMILIEWLYVTDYRLIVAALLHDIIEDCPHWPVEKLQKEYGDEIAELVAWMTKPDVALCGGSKEEVERVYHDRFVYAPRKFFIIKMADRLHNLITLWVGYRPEKRALKVLQTRICYLPWARKHLILHREMDEALTILESGKTIR